jgi:hypothetical protein
MRLPAGDAYYSAIQNPRTAFRDPDLKSCEVEPLPGLFGATLPKPYSGGFTTTYHLHGKPSQNWAVRCFIKDVPELQRRYDAFGRFLADSSSPYFVRATCQFDGIQVNSAWYPIIKMQWVEGQTLDEYVEDLLDKKASLIGLVEQFESLVKALKQRKIAHGDLQHGNIIVRHGGLHLIDYDGVFLPELAPLGSNEIGHPNYQHPGRDATQYGPELDHFSTIVIYLSLKALTVSPGLWRKYNGGRGENILFVQNDFLRPKASQLLNDLAQLPQLSVLVERFRKICALPPTETPGLDEFLSRDLILSTVVMAPQPAYQARSQYSIIDGANLKELAKHVGQRVEVIGRIDEGHPGVGIDGKPYRFLNFGLYPDQTFTLVLWSPALDRFRSQNSDPSSLYEEWVSVTGQIVSYNGRAQMAIDGPLGIRVLGEDEALERLGKRPRPTESAPREAGPHARPAAQQPSAGVSVIAPALPGPQKTGVSTTARSQGAYTAHDAQVMNRLYGGAPQTTGGPVGSLVSPTTKDAPQSRARWVLEQIAKLLRHTSP